MRKVMRRSIFVAVALLLALPAHAAQWEKAIDASGFTGTRPLTCAIGTKLYVTQMHGSTNPASIRTFDTATSAVATATGPTATNFNEVLGFGCGQTNSRIYISGRGRWVKHAAASNLASWTSDTDSAVAAQGYAGSVSDFGLGAALTTTSDLSTDTFGIFTWDLASTSAGPTVNAATGFANYESTSCVVADTTGTNSDIYVGAAIDGTTGSTGKVIALGMDGDGDSLWTPNCGTGVGCENGASAHVIRQCFTNSVNGISGTLAITLAYNTSTGATYATGWASNGTRTISQTLSSTDLRTGVYFDLDGGGAALWAWTAAGVAYKSTGGNFSDATGTTYDISIDGGDTLSGCQLVNGTIPVCLTTGGDVWAFRTPINVRYIGGGSITGTGPIH